MMIENANLDPMVQLCDFVSETEYDDLFDEVILYAKHSILDTLGAMIGGSAMEGIPAVVNYVQEKGGRPESFLICYCGKVPASKELQPFGTGLFKYYYLVFRYFMPYKASYWKN